MPQILLESLRGSGRREDVVPVPAFGDRCVCCNHEATCTRHVVPTGNAPMGTYVMRDGLDVPVCDDCVEHAMQRMPVLMSILIVLGICVTGLGASYGSAGAIAAGAATLAFGVAWLVVGALRERRERRLHGHHAGLSIAVGRQWTKISTRNLALVDRIRLLNPNVRVAGERKDAPRTSEAATAKLVQYVLENTPDELEQARALLASGTVDLIEAQRRLAELEAVLGGGGLQSRLRKLREERAAA